MAAGLVIVVVVLVAAVVSCGGGDDGERGGALTPSTRAGREAVPPGPAGGDRSTTVPSSSTTGGPADATPSTAAPGATAAAGSSPGGGAVDGGAPGGPAGPAKASPTTPAAPATAVTADPGRGPFPVGLRSAVLGDRPVDIWYPANEPPRAATVTIDPVEALAPEQRHVAALLPASLVAPLPTAVTADADPNVSGPFPLVVHSHGFGGWRRDEAAHLEHLASHGYVVAAVEHLERNRAALLAGTATISGLGTQDAADLSAVIDLLTGPGSPVAGHVDPARVALTGLSAGGGAALAAADADPRVGVVVVQAPAATRLPSRPVPVLVLQGAQDRVVPLALVEQAFGQLPSPRALAVLAGAGHASFTDLCPRVRAAGGFGAMAAGTAFASLAPLLEGAEDGCTPSGPDPVAVMRAVNALTLGALTDAFSSEVVDLAALGAAHPGVVERLVTG